MTDLLNEEQLHALKDETKDVIFRFLKAIENEPVNQNAASPTPGFAKAYKELIMPLATKYPSYFRWIAVAIADARDGKEIPTPVHNNYIWVNKATEKQVLKVMLLRGNKEQVFSAAKEVGLISRNTAETEENLARLRGVISLLNDVWGS